MNSFLLTFNADSILMKFNVYNDNKAVSTLVMIL